MSRTKMLIGVGIILFFAGVVYLYAQKANEPPPEFNNPEFVALADKFDALAASIQKANAETLKKLDQVLSNQENILKELAIVKVRASRPH